MINDGSLIILSIYHMYRYMLWHKESVTCYQWHRKDLTNIEMVI